MSHTFNRQFVHLVFATKNLEPFIVEETQNSLFSYITGIVKDLGGILIARSGTSNHIHLLLIPPTNYSISDLLLIIKANSSKWYGKNHAKVKFGWEEGYGAFSVSPESVESVKKYFLTELARHKKYPYENELMNFLNFHEIEFKPQYVTKTTYTSLNLHVVWGVKNRESLIEPSLKSILHDRMNQEIEKVAGKVIAIGNVSDHIHIFISIPRNKAIANIVQTLKVVTTPLLNKAQNMKMREFAWQEGYGVFSVGKPAMGGVANYVRNQEKHHSNDNFTLEQEWGKIVAGNYAC